MGTINSLGKGLPAYTPGFDEEEYPKCISSSRGEILSGQGGQGPGTTFPSAARAASRVEVGRVLASSRFVGQCPRIEPVLQFSKRIEEYRLCSTPKVQGSTAL